MPTVDGYAHTALHTGACRTGLDSMPGRLFIGCYSTGPPRIARTPATAPAQFGSVTRVAVTAAATHSVHAATAFFGPVLVRSAGGVPRLPV